jgi:hypothetical protein
LKDQCFAELLRQFQTAKILPLNLHGIIQGHENGNILTLRAVSEFGKDGWAERKL